MLRAEKKARQMFDPQDDDNRCEHCGCDYDYHTDEEHDECDLKDALNDTPKKGLEFLVFIEKPIKNPEYGRWKWVDLDGLSDKEWSFIRLAVKDGEILKDLGE